jgi:tetratricopeptide (TPR) repeat protein
LEKFQKSTSALLVEALDREIRSRGYGSISQLERALDEQTGWWHYRRRNGDLRLQDLLAVLEHLGLHPIAFLRRHLSTPEGLDLDRPCGEAPPIVEKAWDRVIQGQDAPGVGDDFLEALDRRRDHDPETALKLAEASIPVVELKRLPRLLGIAGSAQRLLLLLDEAEHTLHAAIQMAYEQGDLVCFGNLLRRFSYVALDRGHRATALALAERASVHLLRGGDFEGLAKVAVEQGLCLSYLDRDEEAFQCFQTALARLPEDALRYRCAALQNMARVYENQGQLESALRCLAEAEKLSEAMGARHRAKLLWLRARLLIKLDMHAEAAELLWDVVNTMRSCHLGEAALATCDLVQVQLKLRAPREAYLTATSMRALVEPLHNSKVITAALAELLRAGQEGLTLALVERIKRQIESERRQGKIWLSLDQTQKPRPSDDRS